MDNVFTDQSAITQDALSHLRDASTDTPLFRLYADKIASQLLSSALTPDDLTSRTVTTPLQEMQTQFLPRQFVFVTVLRAGLAMLPAALQLMPGAPVGFLGLRRDEATAVADEYYCNLPKATRDSVVILADPMLATGGSMLHTLEKVASYAPREIRVVSIICAPEGIARVQERFHHIRIITAAVDSHLNERKYIVPGLGDFGDRYFGTEASSA